MILRFCSGSVTPASRSRNSGDASTKTSGSCSRSNRVLDLLRLVEPQHAVVDEDARQAIADRLVNQQRRDRRVDAAAQAADDAAVPDLLRGSSPPLSSHERRHRPVAGAAADVEGEVAQDLGARDRCARLRGGTAARRSRRSSSAIAATGALALVAVTRESGRRGLDEVAVARPHAKLAGRPTRAAARRRSIRDRRVAELAMRRRRDFAAERVGHQLHAVADAEHRHAGVEHRRLAPRRGGFRHAARSARQDDARRASARESRRSAC